MCGIILWVLLGHLSYCFYKRISTTSTTTTATATTDDAAAAAAMTECIDNLIPNAD